MRTDWSKLKQILGKLMGKDWCSAANSRLPSHCISRFDTVLQRWSFSEKFQHGLCMLSWAPDVPQSLLSGTSCCAECCPGLVAGCRGVHTCWLCSEFAEYQCIWFWIFCNVRIHLLGEFNSQLLFVILLLVTSGNGCTLTCILTLFSGRKFSGSVMAMVSCPNLFSQIQDKKTKVCC